MNYVIRYKYGNEYRYLSYFRIMIDDAPDYLFTRSILDAIFFVDKKDAEVIVKAINEAHKQKYGFNKPSLLRLLSV